MKKILIPLLVLALLCVSLCALAEGTEAVGLEVKTEKLPMYASDDPVPAELGLSAQAAEENLPVLVLAVKKSLQLQTVITPKTEKNKKVTLSVANDEIVRVKGNTLTGLQSGETVLTVASEANPDVLVKYTVLIYQPVSRITVTASGKSVAAGESIALTPAFAPENATLQAVTWSSANEGIATVDGNGTVTGVKKGNVRITAAAKDGSGIKANINVKVTQKAQEITLDKTEVTIDTGRNAVLKATVLPKETDDKKVAWTSSDENIATVNAQGRIKAVALGECEIICTSVSNGEVQARAAVHVQQPVTKVTFGEAPAVYAGESAQLTWTTEPANASNQAVAFKSGNQKILTVDKNGTVTGVKPGDTFVEIVTQDGSNRKARVKIKVMQHVTGVHMKRQTAYIDVSASNTTTAIVEPSNASNQHMTWESADPSVATVEPVKKQPSRVTVKGLREGETVITGTTEDGGYQASLLVKVGDWEQSLKLTDAYVEGDAACPTVKNVSSLNITSITIEVSILDIDGQPVPCNKKDNSNTFYMVYKHTLEPNASTSLRNWKVVDYKLPDSMTVSDYVIRIKEFEIDHDWVKLIRERYRPTKKCPVHQ